MRNSSDIYKAVIDYLNSKTGQHFRSTTKSTRQHINARLAEGFTLDDFKCVIAKKCAEWMGDSKMEKYLRPETLFGTKFESYQNAKVTKKQPVNTGIPAGADQDDLDEFFVFNDVDQNDRVDHKRAKMEGELRLVDDHTTRRRFLHREGKVKNLEDHQNDKNDLCTSSCETPRLFVTTKTAAIAAAMTKSQIKCADVNIEVLRGIDEC